MYPIDITLAGLIADVAELKAKMSLLTWFVGATMVPVWIGAMAQLWKVSKVVKFLNQGDSK